MDNKPLITITDLKKTYPGVKALDNINLSFYSGKIHAIAGENGCGKTTLARILAGIEKSDNGSIVINGREITKKYSVKQAEKAGIVMLHQDPILIKDLPVWENIFSGHEKTIFPGCPILDINRMKKESIRILSRLPLAIDYSRTADSLNLCEQHIVQFARALAIKPKVLIVDEFSIAFTFYDMKTIYHYLNVL